MNKSRQQFEGYIKLHTNPTELEQKLKKANNGLNYADRDADLMWISWQASRESLINRLEPELVIYRYSNKINFSFEKSKFDELIKQGFTPLYRLDK